MDVEKTAFVFGQALRQTQGACSRCQGDRIPYLARDVVCGMQLEPATAPAVRIHRGETYYFCSGSCAKEFEADPSRFLLADEKNSTHETP